MTESADLADVSEGDPAGEDDVDRDLFGEPAEQVDPLADDELRSALEAMLLVVDTPASTELLASATEQNADRVQTILQEISADLTARSSGIDLRFSGDGWRFYTRTDYAPYVEKLLLDGARSKLTRAALETLAVIAYRQPVTRSRVSAVRGVNVDGVIRTLVARGLIDERGTDPDSGAARYGTTELFLERLGLSSLAELPDLAPLLPDVDVIDDFDQEIADDPRFAKTASRPSDSTAGSPVTDLGADDE
ncbi:SMC-Scp complex subunit ScpB [Williamsia sterculiae]|uniref:Condensin subunit ScpB n=1 Tax=Williamsia sterculiae TaxID=1344003 RepID=A0A1N7H3Y1_9NOCA|nr:SMC-Scp complex subunit ScpB [Williamsia sterculiae]SIS19554.1 condensin subunit ScpB [Williamsia sterculiae]